MTHILLFSTLAALASAQSVPRVGVVPSAWRAPVQSVLAGINPSSFAAARIGGAEIMPMLSALKNLDLETPAGLRAAEPLIARLGKADTLSGFAALPESRREALLVGAAADVAAESRRESEALLRDAQSGDFGSLRPRLIALASRAPYLGPGGFESLATAVALKEAERRSSRAAAGAQDSVEALERERRERREISRAARSGKPAPQKLGILTGPAEALDGREFALRGWQYLSFRTLEGPDSRLGEPSIAGKPAAESPLQFKHSARPAGREGEVLHEFSLLAIGATPPGSYRVEFPGAGTPSGPFGFTVSVAPKEAAPDRRLSGFSASLGTAEPHAPSPAFAPGVPAIVKSWLPSHQALVDRHLASYERYLREDPLLAGEERAARFAEVERLDRLYADVAAGRVRYGGLDTLIPQLMAAERPVLERFKEYFRADPAQSRVFVELMLAQMQTHRDMLVSGAGVWRSVAAGRGEAPAGPAVRALGGLVRAWFMTRDSWGLAWGALKRRFSVRPAVRGAAPSAAGPRFSEKVRPEQRRFLTSVGRALDEFGGLLRARVADDASLDGAARAAKLAPLERAEEFVRGRAAAEGFLWTNPAMATNLLDGGVRGLIADSSAYAELFEPGRKLAALLEDARKP